MSGSAFAVTHYAFSSGAGRTADRNRSHWSTSKTPSYTKSVSWQHHPPRPLLSLEDFFIDNNIHGSICCNVIPEQSPQAIYHHFLKIRERNNVSDVLVEITMFDDPDWPFSESILVITTASPEEVQSWFVEEIAPDECWEGWSEDTEHGWVEVPVGMHPVTCWWD
ncbi:hypothetical protein NFL20_07240 [Escherichia coli]|nr:hypothetical protein NFL20_07240 [Escherichia coli]